MSRNRNWFFTLNNPEDDQCPAAWNGVVYGVWQKEQGAEGTPHLQGYIHLENPKSLGAMKIICPQAHWEIRRGTHEQAKAYCMKEATRLAGPWFINPDSEPHQGQGKRNDLQALKESIDSGVTISELAEEHFSTMAKYSRWAKEYMILKGLNKRNWVTYTTVVWGPTGTGKTRSVQEKAGPKAYWMKKPGQGQTVFFDGYDGEEDVVIDEFYGWIPYDLLLRMCDRYPLLVDTKGGAVSFCPKRIWITSNAEPHKWYPKAWTPAMDRRLAEPLGKVEYKGPVQGYDEAVRAAAAALVAMHPVIHPGEKRNRYAISDEYPDNADVSPCGQIIDPGIDTPCQCDICTGMAN